MPRLKFSMIITCYNHSSYIKEAVDSALAQTYAEKEVIVIDDCSKDNSRDVLRQYGDSIKLILSETNSGVETARNRGVAVSDGDFLVFLDGDDLFLPWALEVYARVIEAKKPKLILANILPFHVSFSTVDIGAINREISVVEYAAALQRDRWFRLSASSLVVNRQSFFEAGQWLPGTFPWEDVDLTFRMGHVGPTILVASPPTGAWRAHATNYSHTGHRQLENAAKVARKERTGQYPARQYRFARRAKIGNLTFPAMLRAFKLKSYGVGFSILAESWPMFFNAGIKKLTKPFETKHAEEKLGTVP